MKSIIKNPKEYKLFKKFLREKGIKRKFFRYMRTISHHSRFWHVQKCEPDDYVISGFKWDDSPVEDAMFWIGVNSDWLKYLRDHNYEH